MENDRLKTIQNALDMAGEYGLQAEVLSLAFSYVANGESLERALDDALYEWDI